MDTDSIPNLIVYTHSKNIIRNLQKVNNVNYVYSLGSYNYSLINHVVITILVVFEFKRNFIKMAVVMVCKNDHMSNHIVDVPVDNNRDFTTLVYYHNLPNINLHTYFHCVKFITILTIDNPNILRTNKSIVANSSPLKNIPCCF